MAITTTANLSLDPEELAHLGQTMAAQGRVDEALRYLKAAVQAAPDSAQAVFWLGSHYARLGMLARAAECLRRAAELQPQLVMASFHAGLLYLQVGQAKEADAAWAGLLGLAQEHPLHQFVLGLQALMREDFAQAQACLERGIAGNQVHATLNEDMRKILTEIQRPESPLGNTYGEPGVTASNYGSYATA